MPELIKDVLIGLAAGGTFALGVRALSVLSAVLDRIEWWMGHRKENDK